MSLNASQVVPNVPPVVLSSRWFKNQDFVLKDCVPGYLYCDAIKNEKCNDLDTVTWIS